MANPLLTAAQAAELLDVPLDTIRRWRHRGLLTKAGTDTHGRPLYRPADLYAAALADHNRR